MPKGRNIYRLEVFKILKNYKIIFLSVFLWLAFLSLAFADESQFKDVPVSHWAYQAIGSLVKTQIVKGFPDRTFRPNLPVNREQFAAVLTLSLKLPTNDRAPQIFADVPRSHWAFLYIDATKSFIPTPGNPKGSFDFNGKQPITREEVAVSLAGALNLKPNSNVNTSFLQKTFTDYQNISPEYRQQVALAVYNKVMSGNPDGTFRGKGSLTRAELCALMNKLLNDIEAQKPKNDPNPTDTRPAGQPHKPWTLTFNFIQPDYDLVKSFTGVVSSKVYGPIDYYMVLDNTVYNARRTETITKSVIMYVYENDLQWFYEGDMIKVGYDRKNNIISYSFEQQAKPHPYKPPVGGN